MSKEEPLAVGMANSVMTPAVVIRPILLPAASVNQRAPSGPAVIPGICPGVGTANSVSTPAVVIRPIRGLKYALSVNHRAPSGPAVMAAGELFGVGTANAVRTPAAVIRPIRFPLTSVNQRAPSGPAATPLG